MKSVGACRLVQYWCKWATEIGHCSRWPVPSCWHLISYSRQAVSSLAPNKRVVT